MTPVRVMHLLHKLGVGGMEVGVVKLVNGLDRGQIASSIASCLPADQLKDRVSADVAVFEFARRPGNDLKFVAELYRVLRAERPHVLHTHGWGTLCEGLLAARLARVPFVIHGEHGTMDTRPRNLRAQRWVWGRTDAVLSVSSRLAARMARDVGFPEARIRTIRNGVDLRRFSSGDRVAGRRLLGVSGEEIVIGTVGRLVPAKAQDVLVDALGLLKADGIAFRARIVGEGPLRGELQSRANARGLADCLRFTGTLDRVEDVLAAFDLFVLSSASEGLSNTIQEAMAAGLPVVATDVGGADELVVHERTGVLVQAGSPPDLAGALSRLTASPATRQQMGAEGRRRAAAEFTLERMIRDYEEMYLAVAMRRPNLFNVVETCKA
jgi:sugar transferase (PEP-CTERM/EpsH1 system associated)